MQLRAQETSHAFSELYYLTITPLHYIWSMRALLRPSGPGRRRFVQVAGGDTRHSQECQGAEKVTAVQEPLSEPY